MPTSQSPTNPTYAATGTSILSGTITNASCADIENAPFDLYTASSTMATLAATASGTLTNTFSSCVTTNVVYGIGPNCEYCDKDKRGSPHELCSPCRDLRDKKLIRKDGTGKWVKHTPGEKIEEAKHNGELFAGVGGLYEQLEPLTTSCTFTYTTSTASSTAAESTQFIIDSEYSA